MARPSKYSDKLIKDICERIANGESLRSICLTEGMPSAETIRCWLRDNQSFSVQYARAKEDGADTFAEQILDEAQKTDAKNANAVKVKTDILFKLMALRSPKKYNSKIDLTSSDGTMTPDQNIKVEFIKTKVIESEH